MKSHRIPRFSAAIGAALMGSVVLSSGASAATPNPTCAPSKVLTVANSTIDLPCVPANAQILLIVLDNPVPPTTSVPATVAATDGMNGVTDPRIDTYAKRQAIRDQYRGRINETTFNDELGDGVPLEQALRDAIAEVGLVTAKPR